MAKLEIDGRPVEVADNSMIMDATNKLGIYVPHFCYHKKLSIAANCRMCLVQVEKAPKPLPACATPVTEGMKVYTHSDAAIKAQKGVMEFLLINHPLDCPICDQGGECQLQDLAVGYGGSSSRYDEPKRVVANKDLGPLVSAEEMTRCIHCTRCVRFGQEIAGIMELGMGGRGEHSEIMPFVARTVDSELSGNMIDVCPVGALTSKPFRYSARTWELARRKSIAPHDGLGSNLVVQVKGDRVMRVLPLENEDVNECWLSDRDRFSYEALNSAERLTSPMLKRDGKWEDGRLEHGAGIHCRRTHAASAPPMVLKPSVRWRRRRPRSKSFTCWASWRAGWVRQCRFPPAPVGFFRRRAAARSAVAGNESRRNSRARPHPGDRLHAAQGAAAARAALAPGGQEACPVQPDQSGRR